MYCALRTEPVKHMLTVYILTRQRFNEGFEKFCKAVLMCILSLDWMRRNVFLNTCNNYVLVGFRRASLTYRALYPNYKTLKTLSVLRNDSMLQIRLLIGQFASDQSGTCT